MNKKSAKILWISVLMVILLGGIGAALFFLLREPPIKAGTILYTPADSFYSQDELSVSLEVKSPASEEYTFYYTLNGNSVREDLERAFYVTPGKTFTIRRDKTKSVTAYTIRAAVRYKDGSWSQETAHTYFLGEDLSSRFNVKVVSLITNETNLYGDTGIFTNYKESGDEWERDVHVSIYSANGESLIDQEAGIRVHGGWTRELSVKSLRLYARKEYDPIKKSFDYPLIPGNTDINGKEITSYKRLVLRNCGNDINKAFVRDALVQTLAREAGFPVTEAVEPCAVFLNGEYQGFYWMQEYVGEKYFESHLGNYAGDFQKDDHRDTSLGEYMYFNREFLDLAELDLTDDANFKRVTDEIDIENYLRFYALNTLIDNEDWPQNNTNAFRYRPADGEAYGEGLFDGKWRYAVHDNDLSLGPISNHLSNNSLKEILDPDSLYERSKNIVYLAYSPLFKKLMEREDCRDKYIAYAKELNDGVFSADHMLSVLETLVSASENEISYYLRDRADITSGMTYEDYEKEVQVIRDFIPTCWPTLKKSIEDIFGVKVE